MSKKRITHSDKDGNYFIVEEAANKTLTIYLHLASEKKNRELGVVTEAQGVFRTNRNPDKHLFRKNNSYGFNEYVIRTAKKFDKIHLVETAGNEYLFPKDLVLEKGDYLHFKTEGFERQLFLKLSDIYPYKISSL
jgi:hypothetical protein